MNDNLLEGFLRNAKLFSDRLALDVDGKQISYRELDSAAGGVRAAVLGVEEPGPLVGLLAHRSRSAYAGVLGILAAGKAYVPMNLKVPSARVLSMIASSKTRTLVVGDEYGAALAELVPSFPNAMTFVFPVGVPRGLAERFPSHRFVAADAAEPLPPRAGNTDEPLAYVMFTSGTTGEPRGVMVSRENVLAYVRYACRRFDVKETDRFSQAFDLTFDVSVHDLFVAWERGASLHVVPEELKLAPAKFIRDRKLTFWFSTPSVASAMHRLRLLKPGVFPDLRGSMFVGSALPAALAAEWQAAAPSSWVENLYGPTETTIAVLGYRWQHVSSADECFAGVVPIGWPFPEHGTRVEVRGHGDTGELFLCGPQVAMGYWNDPEGTAAKFVERDGAVWYRTGDLVKADERGCHYFLGRVDDQLKLQGFRVELGEIDHALREACGTPDAVAVAWPISLGAADKVYGVVAGGAADETAALAACRLTLPAYMVPDRIFRVDALPLNANGKIDRRAIVETLKEFLKDAA